MTPLSQQLDAALERLSRQTPARDLARGAQRLQGRYRDQVGLDQALSPDDVRAYAAYRMPATFSAFQAALRQVRAAMPAFRPETCLDLGGGTGAATWAGIEAFDTLAEATVVDSSPAMIRLGRALAEGSEHPVLREAAWLRRDMQAEAGLGQVDLALAGYALGELPPPGRAATLEGLIARADTIVVVEPGTPRGFEVVRRARSQLVEAGLALVAPCPHSGDCPIVGDDWCHFAVRLQRSAAHRRAKQATLGYEDEKFSYVAASKSPATPASARIVRHPVRRKGHTVLRLCADGGLVETTVSKSQGTAYRSVRDAKWGDPWPPRQPPR